MESLDSYITVEGWKRDWVQTKDDISNILRGAWEAVNSERFRSNGAGYATICFALASCCGALAQNDILYDTSATLAALGLGVQFYQDRRERRGDYPLTISSEPAY